MRAIFFILSVFTLTALQPAAAQITVSSRASGPFTDAHYITDDRANLVLTIQRELGPLGFGLDIRGWRDPDGVDRAEYFCQPDAVLMMESRSRAQAYYLPYLTWRTDWTVEPELARFDARHVTSMGTYQSLLPAGIRAMAPPVDMRMATTMRRGDGYLNTLFTVTNRSNEAQRMTFVYQDAAYMWFPDGDQRNVESIRIATSSAGFERRVNQESAGATAQGFWQFVGTFNREHGVVAGMLSFTPGDQLGISREYLGITGETIGNAGYVNARPNYRRSDIPNVADGPNVREQRRYINRFIALDFGVVQPGANATRTFYRIATVLPEGERSEDGIQRWVSATVVRLQGG